MKQTMTRSLIETLVRSKLSSLKESPERATRNLVDMALHFSTGRFQKHFFEIAQEMLRNENSPYYQLVYHLVSNIDNDRLLGFGMNVGYNSFTYGAKIIRKSEQQYHFNIPWSITLELDGTTVGKSPEHYHQLLNEGKALGIYSWHIIVNECLDDFLPIMEMNTDCAFFLFCKASEITEQLLDNTNSLNNIMFVVEYTEEASDIFTTLQKRNLLYSTYVYYNEKDIPDILDEELLCSLNETNSVFAFLFSEETCSEESRNLVSRYVMEARCAPTYKTLPFEFFYDIQRLDSIISSDSCSVQFDKNGNLLLNNTQVSTSEQLNHFTHSISDILKTAFPKTVKQ